MPSKEPIELYAIRNRNGKYYKPGGYFKWVDTLKILSKAQYQQIKGMVFDERHQPIVVEFFEVRYKSEKSLETLNGKQA
jgi:hypothetical protein